MFDLILDPANLPFIIAITLAIAIGILELISLLVGGLTDWFDAILPDKDFGDISGFSVMDYLCIGRIPFLMWLVVFLMSYGICGLILQSLIGLNVLLAGIIVLFIAIFPTRYISLVLQKILPQDETTALYSDSFIGSEAVIVLGIAKVGYPAQAKFTDMHNQTHYVMVEPLNANEEFSVGNTIVLYEQAGSIFKAIKKIS